MESGSLDRSDIKLTSLSHGEQAQISGDLPIPNKFLPAVASVEGKLSLAAPLVLSSASYLPSSVMLGSQAALHETYESPTLASFHICASALISLVSGPWKALHFIYPLGDAYCPVRPFLSCSAILLMSQASIVGSTLFPKHQGTHFKL